MSKWNTQKPTKPMLVALAKPVTAQPEQAKPVIDSDGPGDPIRKPVKPQPLNWANVFNDRAKAEKVLDRLSTKGYAGQITEDDRGSKTRYGVRFWPAS